jgi:hypothetical protein
MSNFCNPCKRCIINTMCTEMCDLKSNYINFVYKFFLVFVTIVVFCPIVFAPWLCDWLEFPLLVTIFLTTAWAMLYIFLLYIVGGRIQIRIERVGIKK